eukprot:TRINITY_DN2326_c0_g2_i1.p1 TRINITY_DN2326_c0_g2~~TRINITY_DN2326_c0_g2_i1.p1  ORF type:complete len:560 (+),score=144.34 TRINITY_DN2326_c0_g2_i1:220-1680(+)
MDAAIQAQTKSLTLYLEPNQDEYLVPVYSLPMEAKNKVCLTQPLVQLNNDDLVIQSQAQTGAITYQLNLKHNLYALLFQKKKHKNFVGRDLSTRELFLVSVIQYPVLDDYQALMNTKKGFKQFKLPAHGGSLTILKSLTLHCPGCSFHPMKDVLPSEIVEMELKQQQALHVVPIGLVYCKRDQYDPFKMFENREENACPSYNIFKEIMGIPAKQTPLSQREGIPWEHGINLLWLQSMQLSSDEIRQHIGNTNIVIIFVEEGTFSACMITELGCVSTYFMIIQPYPNNMYRVELIQKRDATLSLPVMPSNYLFDAVSLQNFVIIKAHNLLMALRECPPFNKLFEIPREKAIEELAIKHCPSWLKSTESIEIKKKRSSSEASIKPKPKHFSFKSTEKPNNSPLSQEWGRKSSGASLLKTKRRAEKEKKEKSEKLTKGKEKESKDDDRGKSEKFKEKEVGEEEKDMEKKEKQQKFSTKGKEKEMNKEKE